MSADYSRIPSSALIALGLLILKRAKLKSLPCTTREQAIRIIRGVKIPLPRRTPLHIKAKYELCCVCFKPMVTGSPVDSLGRHHATCELKGAL